MIKKQSNQPGAEDGQGFCYVIILPLSLYKGAEKICLCKSVVLSLYNNMKTEKKLREVVTVYRANLKLEAKIKKIRHEIEQNHQLLIKHIFPYVLSTYGKWQPKRGEKAMFVDFESHFSFEVTIAEINGYRVRAQEGDNSSVYHRFKLNPVLEEYEKADFIIPKWSYDEIKDLFRLKCLG